MKKNPAGHFEASIDAYHTGGHNRNPGRLPLEITWRKLSDLKDYEGHSRRHSHHQIRKVIRSISEFGIVVPVLVDADDVIIAGHALVAAAKKLELAEVPVTAINHLTKVQVRALRLALNRLAEDGTWDEQALRIEIEGLAIDAPDIEITSTGFEMAEIDRLLILPGAGDEDEVPALPENPTTRVGDLWKLGDHRMLCEDALKASSYERLLGGDKAQLMFADPPYNVKVQGHIRGRGKVRHEEFVMASGEMDQTVFTRFLESFMSHAVAHSYPGALHLVCMDWRHLEELLAAGRAAYEDRLQNLIIWSKENAGQGSLYRSRHELIGLWKVGDAPHINNIQLGRHGRYRSNIWCYPGSNSFGKGRDEALALHPTVKPLALVLDAILDLSNRGDVIMDPFGGSGTTLIAAQEAGRKARLIELVPRYADVAIQRWQQRTGETAIELGSGMSFAELARERRQETPPDVRDEGDGPEHSTVFSPTQENTGV